MKKLLATLTATAAIVLSSSPSLARMIGNTQNPDNILINTDLNQTRVTVILPIEHKDLATKPYKGVLSWLDLGFAVSYQGLSLACQQSNQTFADLTITTFDRKMTETYLMSCEGVSSVILGYGWSNKWRDLLVFPVHGDQFVVPLRGLNIDSQTKAERFRKYRQTIKPYVKGGCED